MTSSASFKNKFDPPLLSWRVSILTCTQNTPNQSVPPSVDMETSKFGFLLIESVDDFPEIDFLKLFQINLASS